MPFHTITHTICIDGQISHRVSAIDFFFYGWGMSFVVFSFPQADSLIQLRGVITTSYGEKLRLLKYEMKSDEMFSTIHLCRHQLAASSMGIVSILHFQQDQSLSRSMRIFLVADLFYFILFISCFRETSVTTISVVGE